MNENIQDYYLTFGDEECCFRIEAVDVPGCDMMRIRVFFRNDTYFILAYSFYFLKSSRGKTLSLLRTIESEIGFRRLLTRYDLRFDNECHVEDVTEKLVEATLYYLLAEGWAVDVEQYVKAWKFSEVCKPPTSENAPIAPTVDRPEVELCPSRNCR